MMDANFLKNLTRAAAAGMAHYGSPQDWHDAIELVAKANREQGESIEAAYVRMTRDDPTVRQLDLMRRQAIAQADVQKAKGGRPRKYIPPVSVTKAESRLFELAKARAMAEHTSFERAFVKVIDTDEGRELYRETRGMN